jgi:hypothetical protein
VDILILVGIVIITSFTAGIYKVEETLTKAIYRHTYGERFAFLGNKGYMQLIFFLFMLPLFFTVDWTLRLFVLFTALSLLRLVPWVLVAKVKGRYKDTQHQVTSNFTMLENFAGPIGALLVYGLYHAWIDDKAPFWLYLVTPFAGFFLLWALRQKEKSLNRDMMIIIFLQTLLVAAETIIIVYLQHTDTTFVHKQKWMNSFIFLDTHLLSFMIVIALSSVWIALYFTKEIIKDTQKGLGKDVLRIGAISGLHEILYFGSFAYFGPIFLIARRGMLIPMQNLYLGFKEGKNMKKMILAPLKTPLLKLHGGKDFIISFIDVLFNSVIKFALTVIKS